MESAIKLLVNSLGPVKWYGTKITLVLRGGEIY